MTFYLTRCRELTNLRHPSQRALMPDPRQSDRLSSPRLIQQDQSCRSCDICQRTIPKGRTAKVPLGQMPIIEVPFKRVAVDLVGTIQPATSKGNRYILTVVDFATRFPEAVALKGIETEMVVD